MDKVNTREIPIGILRKKVTCPHCGKALFYIGRTLGEIEIKCVRCKHIVRVEIS